MAKDVEKTNSGVKKKGEWKEVAEFSEEVEEAVKDSADKESIKKFEEWRPKKEEAENNMKQKTVEKALTEKTVESDGANDIKEATKEAVEATKKAAKGENPAKEINKASETAAKPVAEKFLDFFRMVESFVYSKVILRGKRYYLDTEDLSADMKSASTGYQLDVNANTEKSREVLQETFEDAE